ncbi:MAG: hypothetical protein FWF65_09705 [Bacteroidetes bacterium]|nr:hypothetical protein [Bacteroidota bacterium]
MHSKIKKLDFIIIGISIIVLIDFFFYYWNVFLPNGDYGTESYDPFYEYDYNKGIILIQTVNFILWFGILLIGIVWTIKRNIDYKWVYLIFTFCILLFISRWIEFWYGSTFYYGEVRDKQGLTFPVFGLCLVFYAIWRYKLELIDKKQIIIKVIVSILITLLFLGFYIAKYDAWKLGVS